LPGRTFGPDNARRYHMRQKSLIAFAAALLISGASGAYAADSGTAGNPGNPGNKATPQAGGAVKNAPGAESAHDNATRQKLGQWALGKTVYDRAGDPIGTVTRVEDDRIAVSAGADLGIGAGHCTDGIAGAVIHRLAECP